MIYGVIGRKHHFDPDTQRRFSDDGVCVALLLNRGMKGLPIYRAVFYLPSLLGASVAIAVLWRTLFAGDGDKPGKPHPRTYGTFPRVLGEYARDRKLFSLETAVHKMTGMPAARLRLERRGLLREGFAADIAVFNPATVRDESTYPDPHRYPTGISYVIVNGTAVVDGGRFASSRTGRILRPAH